jgi:hypothetical protein
VVVKNFDDMKKDVDLKRHIKSGVTFFAPQAGRDRISVFIDMIKYRAPISATRALDEEFHDSFNDLSVEKRAVLAELDKHFILPAILIADLEATDSNKWIGHQIPILDDIANAIAIASGDLAAISKTDKLNLYRFFVNSRIDPSDLAIFSGGEFLQFSLNKLLSEERVIFTWIVQNLIAMVEQSLLSPTDHANFFVGLFEKSNYIQGELSALFKIAVQRAPDLFEKLASVR